MAELSDVVRHALTSGVSGVNKPATYIPLPSRDPGDTRPSTSGTVPAVHYNIPSYAPIPNTGMTGPWNFFPNLDPGGVVSGAAKYLFNPAGLIGSLTGKTDAQDIGGIPSGAAKYLFSPYGLPGAVSGHTDFSGDIFKMLQSWFGGGGVATPPGKTPKVVTLGAGTNKAGKGAGAATAPAGTGPGSDFAKATAGLLNPPQGFTQPAQQAVGQVAVSAPSKARQAVEQALLASAIKGSNIDYPTLFRNAAAMSAGLYGQQIKAMMQQAITDRNVMLGQTAQGMQTINAVNQGENQILNQLPGQLGSIYDQSIGQQRQIAQATGASLAAQTPNAADQAALQAVGAPQAQQQQVATQNQLGYGLGGSVLTGMGNLQSTSLEAQKANAMAYAKQLPVLTNLASQQALAAFGSSQGAALAKMVGQENVGLSKLYTSEGQSTIKTVQQMVSAQEKTAATRMSAYKALTGQDISEQGLDLQAQNDNQRNTITVNQNNAQNYLASVRAANSAYSAQTSRLNYGLSLYKATHPTASTSQSNSQANAAIKFFETAAGMRSIGSKPTQIGINKATQAPIIRNQPTYSQKGYYQAVREWVASHSNDPNAMNYAVNIANSVWNIGYGGREFDPGMVQVLKAAGQPASWINTAKAVVGTGANGQSVPIPKGTAVLTLAQAKALNNGYSDFASQLIPVTTSKGEFFIIPKLKG